MAANLDAKMKACRSPHAISHSLFGLGLGLVLVGLFSGLVANALMLGIIVATVAVAWDFTVNKG